MTTRKNKPKRPDGCPLYPNNNGTWCANLAGKRRSFGGWSDLPAALRKYEMAKAKLLMGEDPFDKSAQPSKRTSSKTIGDIVDRFTKAKKEDHKRGLITARTLKQVTYEIGRFKDQHGRVSISSLTPEKWSQIGQSFPENWSLGMFNTRVKIVRSCFNYAMDAGWIEPMRYGKFCVVKQGVLKKHKAKKPQKLYTPEEILKILEFCSDDLKACILLTLSTGMGGTDLSLLRMSDIENGFIVGRRNKTQVERKAPLWPEVAALLAKLDRADDECLFRTQRGLPLVGAMEHSNNYQSSFKRACVRAGVDNRGPYLLRSITQTICEQANVPLASLATSKIMGHKRAEISETYRKEGNVPDHQIRRVSQYLHAWLYKADIWREVAALKNDVYDEIYQPQPVYEGGVLVGYRQISPHPQEALDELLKDHPELR